MSKLKTLQDNLDNQAVLKMNADINELTNRLIKLFGHGLTCVYVKGGDEKFINVDAWGLQKHLRKDFINNKKDEYIKRETDNFMAKFDELQLLL